MAPSVSVRDTMRVVTPRISSIRRTGQSVLEWKPKPYHPCVRISSCQAFDPQCERQSKSTPQREHRDQCRHQQCRICDRSQKINRWGGFPLHFPRIIHTLQTQQHTSIPNFWLHHLLFFLPVHLPTLERMGRTTRFSIRAQPSPLVAHSFS